MKYDGSNIEDVIKAHMRWIKTGGENDEDRADFSGLDLKGAVFTGLNLYGAIFRNTNLYMACFYRANIERADFTGANLWHADLFMAHMRGAIGLPFIPQYLPDTGSFIGWKKVKLKNEGDPSDSEAIAKLLIPEDAQRMNIYLGECRASKVKVLEIQDIDGNPLPGAVGISIKDPETLYIPGEIMEVNNFGTNYYQAFLPGIYFYPERKAAVYYMTRGNDSEGRIIPIAKDDVTKLIDSGFTGWGTLPNVLLGMDESEVHTRGVS